jgi:hypothetical protein
MGSGVASQPEGVSTCRMGGDGTPWRLRAWLDARKTLKWVEEDSSVGRICAWLERETLRAGTKRMG